MEGSHSFDVHSRLSPEMVSRRLQVLAFVRDYLAKWRKSPSQGEIAAGLGVARTTVRRSLRSLWAEGLLLRTPGERGLTLPEEREAAVRTLAALGCTVWHGGQLLGGPVSTLLPGGVLDYLPPEMSGAVNGQVKRDRAGAG